VYNRYLNRTATHPVLQIDPDFREFLEREGDLPKATNTSALSGAGVLRLFHKVGDVVEKISFRMDESDEVGGETLYKMSLGFCWIIYCTL
jgi:sorting nexin-1/2